MPFTAGEPQKRHVFRHNHHNHGMPPATLKIHTPQDRAESPTNSPHADGSEPCWDRTRAAEERLPQIPVEHGYFKGRLMIHHDSPIAGGVCVGSYGREAIVVDWRNEARRNRGASLATLYDTAVQRATVEGRFRKSLALQAVYNTVDEHFIDRSNAGVARVNRGVRAGPDTKVHIDCYIEARAGVCRHMALTCAAILERMVEQGLLAGKVSNDRNSLSGQGAHAWCRYTSSTGGIVILDVMQKFFGSIEKAQKLASWDYTRPEERSPAA